MILVRWPVMAIVAISVVIAVFLLVVVLLWVICKKIRDMVFNKRYDDNHTLKYFYAEDFENLVTEPIEFISKGNKIKGFIYKDSSLSNYKGVIVFSHGLGAGHVQYTTEIDHLAKLGYLVVAYDVSGTGKSEGKTIKGLTTALYNLDDCLTYVKSNPILSKYKIMVFAHSMGAYAANNITRYHKDLIGVVSLSGFNSTYELLNDEISMVYGSEIKGIKGIFKALDKKAFGKEGLYCSIDALKETSVNYLIVTGDKDNVVNVDNHYKMFKQQLKDKENFKFISVEGRYHRPLLTIEAAEYDQETNEYLKEIKSAHKNQIPREVEQEYYESLDYNLLVQMDSEILEEIDEFIEYCFNK